MESSPPLFSLSIDQVTKSHLNEASRWARFLAIVGMISVALLVLAGIYVSMTLSNRMDQQFEDGFKSNRSLTSALGIGMIIMYIIIAVVWFIPFLYLLRFANQSQAALHSNNQEQLNTAFQNLKICFRYVGIVTLIGMAFYLLSIIITFSTGQGISA